ncbi:MAG: hypothetical protein J7513_00285 [Solirubrobacteraceae bacterium]|nr:hypothetical protein [Solirubrobacteraceae bacterium]
MTPPPTIVVHDLNRDALMRRAATAASVGDPLGFVTRGTSSITGARLLALEAAPGSIALIDLYDGDRRGVARVGEPLIRSCVAAGVRAYAWTAHTTADALHGALTAGATGVVAVGDPAQERAAITAALSDDLPASFGSVTDPAEAPWADWFHAEFGTEWKPGIEVALARLAETGERAAQADTLRDAGIVEDRSKGTTYLRKLAQRLAGERDRSPAYVAEEASRALTMIASYRPLLDRPEAVASLHRASEFLAAEPSLTLAAGLTPSAQTQLHAMTKLIDDHTRRKVRPVGSPGAGAAEEQLLWAARNMISERRLDAPIAERLARGLAARTMVSAVAVAEARRDTLYHPGARLAAALVAAQRQGVTDVPTPVSRDAAGVLRWKELTAHQLIEGVAVDAREAADVTRALDAGLASRSSAATAR